MRVGPLKLKLQLVCGEAFALGPGKADLLDAIERDGSISAAGRTLGMSYRRTWILVDEMNRCFTDRLVETLTGGGRQRGARLTETGRTVLAAYRQLEEQSARSLDGECYRVLAELVRNEPLAAKATGDI
ncbi:LysR family transcriptional regulator [Sphingomonas paeninsulae]|jgi:molybdate transport system regulatory protein|uniref:LysR family transcriptional regulator n=1 Tax=Sphingomonas paeninsulae TaxID=2319844 RepID=A0A494TNC0_SPHPE|nr:LysR family transcriptional regulator [Sphingomonas paeninsulae]AYJ87306.1 LysR family transcriptional regulator [Sphingomonas paeninsulae]